MNEERQSNQPEEIKNPQRTWLGTSLSDIYGSVGPWNYQTSPVKASKYHNVLYKLPLNGLEQPVPRYSSDDLAWDEDHVRMPFSPKNLFPVKENGVDVLKPRWDIIKKALNVPIQSSYDLEKAIKSYSNNIPTLSALHYFFESLEEEEANQFFTCVLPGIIDLALHLPEIVPGNIPLLKKNYNRSISMSQVQVASILANAFLCTFPWRKDVALTYPGVNFIRLFSAHSRPKRQDCIMEKLKCIFHYFRRILSKQPAGVITFERKFVPKNSMPRWDMSDKNLGNTRVHIDSAGTIEDNGTGCLQIDFANKFVGGGVLGYGCVQEEIRFVICPELIVSRLFIEQLCDNEAVVITGAERYSKYIGYGDCFQWAGNFVDETPYDEDRRRRTAIAVIDATHFKRASDQFYPSAILRELNKAYVGFSAREKFNLAPVATGNWGCGAFKGSPYLKTLIQFMACCAANRDLVYFSFGNDELRDDFYNMYLFLGNNRITIMQLWKFICSFIHTRLAHDKLYSYLQQSYFDSKKQKPVSDYFKKNAEEPPLPIPSTSKKKQSNLYVENHSQSNSECEEISQNSSTSEDIVPSSQLAEELPVDPVKNLEKIKKKLPDNHEDILQLISAIDGKPNKTKEIGCSSFLFELDKVNKKQKPNTVDEVRINIESDDIAMEVDDISVTSVKNSTAAQRNSSKKITDYFTKLSKTS